MASQTNSTIVSKIYTSRQTILEQLELRGFDISNYNNFSVNETHLMMQNKQCDMLLENNLGHKVFIKYHISKALRENYIYDLVEELFKIELALNKKTDSIIYIAKTDANDTITKCLTQLYDEEGIMVQVNGIKRLQFNILDHNLVPLHTILTDDEATQLKIDYNITADSEIPELSRFDPVAVAIGIRPGQICKILRKSKTAIEELYYRICV